MDPRRKGSHCSRSILSLLRVRKFRTGPSTGKVMATICWAQDGILLVDFLSPVRPAKLWPVHPTPAETEEWHPGQATEHWHQVHYHSSRQLAYSYILRAYRPRVTNLRNWYGRWFLTRRTALIWRHPTSTCSDYWKTSSVASSSQITANWIRQWVYHPKM